MRTGLISSSRPDAPLTEREEWEYAALLLDRHGEEDIVHYVADRYGDCVDADDDRGAASWMSLVAKIERLMTPRDGKRD